MSEVKTGATFIGICCSYSAFIYCILLNNYFSPRSGFGKRHIIDGLEPEHKFSYRLSFKNNHGVSEWSQPVVVSTTSELTFRFHFLHTHL